MNQDAHHTGIGEHGAATSARGDRRPSRRILVVLFIALFAAMAYTHQADYRGPLAASRLDLLHALFVHKSFKIDAYHKNTPDKAVYEGHYYSDKAPGTVFLSLPAFSLSVVLLKLCRTDLDSDAGWLASSWITCAGSIALIVAAGGVALFLWLCQWVGPRPAYLATLAIFLGAAPLPYSTFLMCHALTVALLAIALWAGRAGIHRERNGETRLIHFRDCVAGCCCGLALASEFSAGIAVCGILLLFVIENPKRVFSLVLGMTPALSLVPAYNWVCFGSPLAFAYHHQAAFTEMHTGFFGINRLPDARSAYHLLFGVQQGLFVWSPVLLLALVGYFQMRRTPMELFFVTYLVPLFQVVAISAYFLPRAGGALGPRLLSSVLPLMALPVVLGIVRFPRTGLILTAISVLLTAFATVIDICIPTNIENPLLHFFVPAFLAQKFSPNLGSVLGLPGYSSLLPMFLMVGFGIWLSWRDLSGGKKSYELETIVAAGKSAGVG